MESDRLPPALSAQGLHRAYGESWVLVDLSLSLGIGETLAVIGPNGAGKSTLLRILATLLRPSAGEVRVLGCTLPSEAWRLRGRIGYVGHSSLLYRDLSAEENLRFQARLYGLPDSGRARIAELLDAVGLSHRAGTRIAEMSAGMVQRIAICRAVLHEPELLLLDEPLANLDVAGAEAAASLVGPEPGRTRVVVTHDITAALADADRVVALSRDGRPVYEGTAAGLSEVEARAIYSDRAASGRLSTGMGVQTSTRVAEGEAGRG